jgi:hypothetical protein
MGLLVAPPGEVRFSLPAGALVLEGWYGIAHQRDRGTGGGVTFRVELVDPTGGASRLFERHLNPWRERADGGAHALRVPFVAAASSALVLRTDGRSTSRAVGDWPYWAEVRIVPAR